MLLKKFYGKDIKDARNQAREALGDHFVVLESVDATEGRSACVTVMLDRNVRKDITQKRQTLEEQAEQSRNREALPKAISRVREAVAAGMEKFNSNVNELFHENGSAQTTVNRNGSAESKPGENGAPTQTYSPRDIRRNNRTQPPQQSPGSPSESPRANAPAPEDEMSRRGNSLYDAVASQARAEHAPARHSPSDKVVDKEVKALHRRFDQLEQLMSDSLMSANLKYVSHPAFQQLLETGMEPMQVSRWFETILNRGIEPFQQPEAFMQELASIVRDSLSVAPQRGPARNMMFVGASGSGKTSLIMKLAADPGMLGNKEIVVITLELPGDEQRYSPLPLFAEDHGVPHYRVGSSEEWARLMPQLQQYDHILFDTPSISLDRDAGFRKYWELRQVISAAAPIEIHFVVNATLERTYFKEDYALNHPLKPDFLAITHLDETSQWGHLVPFVHALGCRIRFTSRGTGIPDGLQPFNPAWFAEQMLSNTARKQTL